MTRETTSQKTPYEQQEKDNWRIPGRTCIFITSSVTTKTEGKQVLAEIQHLNAENEVTSGWERYVLVKNQDFPCKRLVASMSHSFVDTRRAARERYLQHLSRQDPKFARIVGSGVNDEDLIAMAVKSRDETLATPE
ncbi:hypothetical protein BS47DRAFT_1364103 [Hydnum rufescens UP504]|uniref:Uncharacterized protein n=1 Tax=Hydnum rufescens UP504 TaxID=1448309 RepID=A0A9P6DTW9_9AGAM|nr:hypothetical protein BS47DRAFT_1364103 [Hydnum rufescens UP504]